MSTASPAATADPRPAQTGLRPPGPKGHAILGNLGSLARDAFGFLKRCGEEYGDVVSLQLGRWPAVFLNSPAAAEQVLIKNHENFIKHRYAWRHVRAVFGKGLFLSEGAFWQRQRRLSAPAFVPRRVASYGENMVKHAERMIGGWVPGERRDLHADMMALTLVIACDTFFRTELKSDVATVGKAVDDIANEFARRRRRFFPIPDWVPLPSHLVYRMIRERKQDAEDRGDLLSALVRARDEAGKPMSDRQLRDEVITLLLAGQETTALILTWIFYVLGVNPEADRQVYDELKRVLGGRLPTAEDLPNLKYTESVVLETMRLYPPVWVFGREAIQDCEIDGYKIPAGTTILISPWVIHHDSRYYDDPDAFRPERWADGLMRKLPRLAYLPFSGGPRVCLGNGFAMQELTLALATIAQRYRLEVRSETPIDPIPSITLRPKSKIWVEPVYREARH